MYKSYFELGKKWYRKNSTQSILEKFKISIISIILGIVVGCFIILGIGENPINIFKEMFVNSFKTSEIKNRTLIFTSIFAMAGLANAFAFKTGLFNIGVSGQMLAGGAISILLGLTVFSKLNAGLSIFLMMISAIGIGSIVGLFIGLLKAHLNVHEVVSSILINWIIFYFIKYLFRTGQSFMQNWGDSKSLPKAFRITGSGTNGWIILFVLVAVVAIMIFIILKFTTFGKKLTMTGINKDAAKYAGINIKVVTILSLTISAAIGGLLGFMFFNGHKYFVPRQEESLPTWGFDGIAIALLAFSSPLVIPFVSILYGVFKSGAATTSIDPSIANETMSLIFAIIILFAAISNLFIKFKPFKFIRFLIKEKTDKDIKVLFNEKKVKIDKLGLDIKKLKASIVSKKEEIKTNDSDDKKIESEIIDISKEIQNLKGHIKQANKTYVYKKNKKIESKISHKININYKSTWLYLLTEINAHYTNNINEEILKVNNILRDISSDMKLANNVKDESFYNWLISNRNYKIAKEIEALNLEINNEDKEDEVKILRAKRKKILLSFLKTLKEEILKNLKDEKDRVISKKKNKLKFVKEEFNKILKDSNSKNVILEKNEKLLKEVVKHDNI